MNENKIMTKNLTRKDFFHFFAQKVKQMVDNFLFDEEKKMQIDLPPEFRSLYLQKNVSLDVNLTKNDKEDAKKKFLQSLWKQKS